LAIIKTSASTVKISEHSTYILDLREPEILSGTLSKGALVVQFLKSKLMKKLKKEESGTLSSSKILKIKTRSAAIAVRGTKFFTYSGIKTGSILTVESGTVDFKGKRQDKVIAINKNTSSMTNEEKMALKPRKFGFEKGINWSFGSSTEEENLSHDPKLYSQLEKVWENYKKEQVEQWNEQKKDMNNKWNNMFND
jgi:hypothetical protein